MLILRDNVFQDKFQLLQDRTHNLYVIHKIIIQCIVYLEGGCKFNKDNYYIFSKIAKVLSRLLIYCSGQI